MFKWFKRKHDYDPIPCILETGLKDKEGIDIWLTGFVCKRCGDMLCNIPSSEINNLPDDLLYGCKGKKKRRKK